MKDVVKIFLRRFKQGFSKEVNFFYCFDGKYETAKRRVMAKISLSLNEWRSDFWLLRLPIVCNIMEETSSVTVCSGNIGNLINTRREVLEACITELDQSAFIIKKS